MPCVFASCKKAQSGSAISCGTLNNTGLIQCRLHMPLQSRCSKRSSSWWLWAPGALRCTWWRACLPASSLCAPMFLSPGGPATPCLSLASVLALRPQDVCSLHLLPGQITSLVPQTSCCLALS